MSQFLFPRLCVVNLEVSRIDEINLVSFYDTFVSFVVLLVLKVNL